MHMEHIQNDIFSWKPLLHNGGNKNNLLVQTHIVQCPVSSPCSYVIKCYKLMLLSNWDRQHEDKHNT